MVVLDGKRMDGHQHSYVPGDTLAISPDLRLHKGLGGDLDPVTYEVLRHSLWNINEEHGITIVRVSGSPIAAFGYDFNPCIMTEDGEFVYFGPYLQFHSGMQDLNVKWILENRSVNPGIFDGDMFLSNDPWIGTCHQQDTALMCPVFVGGELFCWVGNTLHFADLGGSTPGGWSPAAMTVFDEPVPTPPIKIMERGRLRADISDVFVRRSRLPQSVALDLRAVIAGNTVAKNRILHLVERYGADTVKSVMRRIVDDSERVFLDRLSQVPDGVWRERGYLEVAYPGDRGVYQGMLTLEKQGSHLHFDNAGTDGQVGSINVTYAAWRGGILSVLNPFMGPDLLFAIGGMLRHVSFTPTPGAFTTADHPAAVCNGGGIGTEFSISLANNVLARMMYSSHDVKLRRYFTANNGISQWPVVSLNGVDQRGDPYQNMILDWYAAPVGAYSFRDGIATGGVYWGPKQIAPNVEHNEEMMPILYLYRREIADSGGAGKFVGGSTVGIAFTAHGTEQILHQVATCGLTHPTSMGLFAGNPGVPNTYLFQPKAAEGELSLDAMREAVARPDAMPRLSPKTFNLIQRPGDVYVVWASGAAGYGDPLERDLDRVQADIDAGYLTPDVARSFLGVVVEHGVVQPEATAALRKATREARVGGQTRQLERAEGPEAAALGEYVALCAQGKHRVQACRRCRTVLAPEDGNYKDGCHMIAKEVAAAHPLMKDPKEFIDVEMVYRQFVCPGCGGLIETEIARASDGVLHDTQLRLQ